MLMTAASTGTAAQCCNRIVNEGEAVIMAKVDAKTTRIVHLNCADRPFSGGWTFADALAAWGTEYLRACGYRRLPPHPMSSSSPP